MALVTRRKFIGSAIAATGSVVTLGHVRRARALAPSKKINVGFISCGGRARSLMSLFDKTGNVNVAAICDPDQGRMNQVAQQFGDAKRYLDLRDLIGNPELDAVVVATCNHWHCLAAIWAMEAGKHVYVEKPLSHTQWEGRQTVNAARRYDRVCQLGTQQRSDPMQAEIKQFLHEEKRLGAVDYVMVNRYGVRGSIGKRDTPLEIPKGVNYDLWLGPAEDRPIFRDKLQYDWHWDWNTGSGEMGNWGVHVLDDARNVGFRDEVALPKQIVAGGGRVVWNDAGQSPNVHFAYYDTGAAPVFIGLSNLPAIPDSGQAAKDGKKPGAAPHKGPGSGYVVYCEGGRLEGQRGGAKAFDAEGKLIKEFKGTGGNGIHQQNFVQAVMDGSPDRLNSEVEVGHISTGWCNLGNVGFQAGRPTDQSAASGAVDHPAWRGLVESMGSHLAAHGLQLSDDAIRMSPHLTFDSATETFVGDHAESANKWLKRNYRAGYEVPEISLEAAGV